MDTDTFQAIEAESQKIESGLKAFGRSVVNFLVSIIRLVAWCLVAGAFISYVDGGSTVAQTALLGAIALFVGTVRA